MPGLLGIVLPGNDLTQRTRTNCTHPLMPDYGLPYPKRVRLHKPKSSHLMHLPFMTVKSTT